MCRFVLSKDASGANVIQRNGRGSAAISFDYSDSRRILPKVDPRSSATTGRQRPSIPHVKCCRRCLAVSPRWSALLMPPTAATSRVVPR